MRIATSQTIGNYDWVSCYWSYVRWDKLKSIYMYTNIKVQYTHKADVTFSGNNL